ncbi:MAG TPA: TetR/AcrR family transcriptional regulator [Sphingobium sp.]
MPGKKTDYHHGNLKEALIELAARLIETDGYENLTMQSLTEGVGVQPSAAYRHFRNREFLLRSLAKRSFDRWDSEIRQLIADTPPKEQAEAFFRYFLSAAQAQPQMFRLMFVSEYGRGSRSIAGMVSFLTLELAIAHLMPGDGEDAIRTRLLSSWAALHGTALLLIEGRLQRFYIGEMDTGALIDHLVATQFGRSKGAGRRRSLSI